MITVTDKAANKIKEVIKSENLPPEQGLRMVVRGGGCAGFYHELFFDEKKEKDIQFDFDGFKIFIDEMSLMYLNETELDYEDTLISSAFKFRNEKFSNKCGCGQSFSV